MTPVLTSFVAGVVFAIGLGLAGMTQPAKVFAFLDLFGRWDPSLAFVMGGAIAVHAVAYRIVARRSAPALAPSFSVPRTSAIDGRLLGGAVLFGVGWGIGGYCPGPAVTSLASLALAPVVVVGSMIVGMLLHRVVESAGKRPAAEARSPAPAGVAAASAATDG